MRLNENVGRRDARSRDRAARPCGAGPGDRRDSTRASHRRRPRDTRRIVGRQVVAESVALVDGAPERAGSGLNREARAIADAGREDTLMSAVGIEGEHVGAALLVAERGADRRFGDAGLVRRGTPSSTLLPEPTDTNNVLSSGEKARSRVQCPPPLGKLRDLLGRARRLHVSAAIGKAHDRAWRRDIDPLRVRP